MAGAPILGSTSPDRLPTGTQKPLKCAKRLGVRRLDAAFVARGANVVLACTVAARKFQGGVKPPSRPAEQMLSWPAPSRPESSTAASSRLRALRSKCCLDLRRRGRKVPRRRQAAFAPCGANVVLARTVAARKFQGGVKPPHSKVPSAQAFSGPQIPKLGVSATDRR